MLNDRAADADALVVSAPHAPDEERPRILFVDDETSILSGLRRALHPLRNTWDLEFADSGHAALEFLARCPVDVVVSDMRMPLMSGADLLAVVSRSYPNTGRLMLSGHAEREMVVSAVGPTQQYLAKPCDTDLLVGTIRQMLESRSLVVSPRLREVLGTVSTLPKPPTVHAEIMRATGDPRSSVDTIVDIVQRDVATVAEILHLVNSAFFGLPHVVESIERAVTLLGMDVIEALAVAGAVFGAGAKVPPGLDLAEISARGTEVATTCRRISDIEKWPRDVRADLFFAGLMHEVGLLVLAVEWPEQWSRLREAGVADPGERDAIERELFGCSVTEASAYLLSSWGFRRAVVELLAAQPCNTDDRPQKPPAAQVLSLARSMVSGSRRELTLIEDGWLDAVRLRSWLSAR